MSNNGTDYLERTSNGTSFSGSDVNIFAAYTIASGIQLYLETGMFPTRGVTIKSMCAIASRYTMQTYKGRKGLAQAVRDLRNFAGMAKVLPKAEVNPRS